MGVLQQYWAGEGPYEYVSVDQFSEAFRNSPTGQRNAAALAQPYDKTQHKKEALVHSKRSLTGLPALPLLHLLLLPTKSLLCSCLLQLMPFSESQLFTICLLEGLKPRGSCQQSARCQATPCTGQKPHLQVKLMPDCFQTQTDQPGACRSCLLFWLE